MKFWEKTQAAGLLALFVIPAVTTVSVDYKIHYLILLGYVVWVLTESLFKILAANHLVRRIFFNEVKDGEKAWGHLEWLP